MANKKFEEQLAALDSFRNSSGSTAAIEGLRKALANRSNYLVAKAAKIAGEESLNVLVADLVAALDRFFVDPVKSDPQCWAKNAIVKALADMGHDDAAVYLRGLRHVQMEPSWGGAEDSAGTLRGQCALALVQCRSISDLALLSHLLELLFDGNQTVRMETARAIGRVTRPEAALILRVRALAGDREPEVLGACFSALLNVEGSAAIEFVARFLDSGADIGGEAALALGMLRDPRALAVLTERWPRERDSVLASVLLTAIALMRLAEATDFLIKLCASGSPSVATTALKALASAPVSPEARGLIEEAVKRNGDATVYSSFQKHFTQL
jgi:HEAT repeat protein